MISDSVLTTAIGAASGIVIAYIAAARYRDRKPRSKEYVDVAVQAYESVIKQLNKDNTKLREDLARAEQKASERQ